MTHKNCVSFNKINRNFRHVHKHGYLLSSFVNQKQQKIVSFLFLKLCAIKVMYKEDKNSSSILCDLFSGCSGNWVREMWRN